MVNYDVKIDPELKLTSCKEYHHYLGDKMLEGFYLSLDLKVYKIYCFLILPEPIWEEKIPY